MNDLIITIPQIRESIISSLGAILLPLGFKVKNPNGENVFLRKRNLDYTEIQFFYNDYYPWGYEVYLTFGMYQSEIVNMVKQIYATAKQPFYEKPNIIMTEGDFVSELRDKKMKLRKSYKNKLVNQDDLDQLIKKYTKLVNETLLPLETVFTSIEGVNKNLSANKEFLVANCSVSMIETNLICSYKLDDENFQDLHEYYLKELTNKAEEFGWLIKNEIAILLQFRRMIGFL